MADGVYRVGSRGDEVFGIQTQLKNAGFDPGAIDGIFGPNTEAALKRFQLAAGITSDGIYGNQTRNAIGGYQSGNQVSNGPIPEEARYTTFSNPSAPYDPTVNFDAWSAANPGVNPNTATLGGTPTPTNPILRTGVNGSEVSSLQTWLKSIGFDPGAIDGVYGPKTAAAVAAWQRSAGLNPDGIFGPKSWEARNSSLDTWVRNEGELAEDTGSIPGDVGGGGGGTGGPSGGGGTGGPVTDLPTTGATDPFTYDPATDPEYQAAARELNRQIEEAMNSRGIWGSSIMGKNILQGQAELIGDYRDQAYNKYQQELSDKQVALDRAYENAQRRGYFNNEEAALWGVPPGTRVTSSSSGTKSTGSTTKVTEDGTKYDKNGDIIYSDTQVAAKSTFKSSYKTNPVEAISFIMDSGLFTDTEIAEIFSTMGFSGGKSLEYWLEQWYKTTEQGMYDNRMAMADAQGMANAKTGRWTDDNTGTMY